MAYNMRLQSTMSGMVLDILSPTLRDGPGRSCNMSLDEGTLWQEPGFVTQTDEQDDRWFDLSQLADGTAYENGMVVRSAKFRRVLDTVKKLSGYKTTVLIQGESGTGKELVARALHDLSPVAARPFVVFNCSNLVEH